MASQSHAILALTLVLNEPVRRNTFVDLSGATAERGGYAFGVATVNGEPGDAIAVEVLGTAQVWAGSDLTPGEPVEVGPKGCAVRQTTGTMVGRALQAARGTVNDEIVEILLIQS